MLENSAHGHDALGFNRFDLRTAYSLFIQERWTVSQETLGRKILYKYRFQLIEFGIKWEDLASEIIADIPRIVRVKAQYLENSSKSIKVIIGGLVLFVAKSQISDFSLDFNTKVCTFNMPAWILEKHKITIDNLRNSDTINT